MSKHSDQRLLEGIQGSAGPEVRILNVPAGKGRLSAALASAGYEVVSADLFPEDCTLAPHEVVAVDVNERLPFADDEFDGLVCQEGVEHLENPGGFLRECRRVLRDGAHLWLTTPNFMDLSSRMAYLLSGQKSYRAGLPNERSTIWGRDEDRIYHGHAFTLPWFQLRYLLRVNHFNDIRLEALAFSTSSRVLYPLLRPWIGWVLSHGLRTRQRRDRVRGKPAIDDALRAELYREGVSRSLLCGRRIFVYARLREGSF